MTKKTKKTKTHLDVVREYCRSPGKLAFARHEQVRRGHALQRVRNRQVGFIEEDQVLRETKQHGRDAGGGKDKETGKGKGGEARG